MTPLRAAVIVLLLACLVGAADRKTAPTKTRRDPRSAQRDVHDRSRALLGLRDLGLVSISSAITEQGKVAFDIDIDGVERQVVLEPHAVRSPTAYQVLVQHADGSYTEARPGAVATYRGHIAGLPGSLVAASRDDGGFSARLRLDGDTELWLEPLEGRVAGAGIGAHALYGPEDVLPHGRSCANDVRKQVNQQAIPRLALGGSQCIAELGVDADVEYFNNYGSVAATEARINAIMNAVNLQYEAEVGITHQITTIIVRTANPDPYTSTDAETRLCEFITEWTNNQTAIQRDLAQLFTGVEIAGMTIGIAADIGGSGVCVNSGACTGGPFGPLGSYCLAQSDFNPTFGCATDLSAHELGHLWGAFHCSCPSNTMNSGITCANTFSGASINSIVTYRDTRSCLDGSCLCDLDCAPGSTAENEPQCGAEYDDTFNGGCNSTVPMWSSISVGDTVCGASGNFTVAGSDSRDTDWYQFTLASATTVQWCIDAEFPALYGFVDDGGGSNCAGAAFVTSDTAAPCQQECITASLGAGTWTAFVAPETFNGVVCGKQYNGTLNAVGACCDGASCTIDTQAACTGNYLGDGTTCESTAGSPTTYAQSVNQGIPDNNPANPLVNVINVPDAVTVGDVEIDLEATHTWVGDLVVTVEHGGTSVTVIDRPGLPDINATFGCSSNDYNITLDDEGAGGAIEDLCLGNNDTLPTSPPGYTPNNPLSAFDGMNASGNWTITIADLAAPDPGTLVQWAVRITEQGPDPCNDLCAGVDCSSLDDDCAVGVCNPIDGSCVQDTGTLSGQECRAAAGPCDVAETCDGVNPGCPADQFNTGPCDDGNACTTNDSCAGGVCVGGVAPDCDDGNVCTTDSCDSALGCQNANNGLACDDGNACTTFDTCAAGSCVGGSPPDCDDGNPCTTDTCDTGLGCQSASNTAPCDDGSACTTNDTCARGVCVGGAPPNCDDGNPCTDDACNPSLGCVTANNNGPCDDGIPCTENDTCAGGTCSGTAVDCSTLDDACNVGACNVTTGVCEAQPANDGGTCDDGAACTTADVCNAGSCAGTLVDCSSLDDACNVGVCNTTTGACQAQPANEGSACDDGSLCTAGDACDGGACVGNPIAGCQKCVDAGDCGDGNLCTTDSCPAGVCVYSDNTLPCDDGDPCTTGDVCTVGTCTSGSPVDCSSLDSACTVGQCNGVTGACEVQPANEGGGCADGDLCTTGDVCTGGACNGTAVDCSGFDDTCNIGTCNTGACAATPANEGGGCDDGDPCTTGDMCAGGACGGLAVDCSGLDGPCTTGTCTVTTGVCEPTPANEGGACNDGEVCTTGDACTAGTCTGAPADCTSLDDTCNAGVCNATTGACEAQAVNNGGSCDDGDPCTAADICTAGSCGGTTVDCSGLNDTCNVGVCNATNGACEAQAINDGGRCDDSDVCTTADTCTGGLCTGSAVDCSSLDDDCNTGTCNATTGACEAQPANEGGTCADGDACTTGDTCAAGVCSGTATDCSSLDDACNNGVCNPVTGSCQAQSTNEGGACDDGILCTSSDACATGACVGTPIAGCQKCVSAGECDDGNPCTDNLCPSGTCVFVDNTAPCDDGNPCTLGDVCAGGICTAGNPTDCSSEDSACTVGACNIVTGACEPQPANDGGTCNDGNACTTGDSCAAGMCVGGAPADCADGNPCTDDSCDTVMGCQSVNNAAPCDDGNACTTNDQCSAGTCTGGAPPDCDDGNVCTDDTCDTQSGCVSVANNAPCDDASACTTGDACAGGTCIGGPPLDCSDGNGCTDDICDTVLGCQNPDNTAPCDDGNACTTDDVCNAGPCAGGPPPNCNDGNPCTDDSCDAQSGCQNSNNTASCDDDNACTIGDACAGGACVSGTPADCDDGNACTTDSCDTVAGCQSVDNMDSCDDGDPCTTGDVCSAGACTPGSPIDCSTLDGPCSVGLCVAGTCETQPTNDGGACDDGDACTIDDMCAEGTCTGGDPIVCDDGNPCTIDTCAPESGCAASCPGAGAACDAGTGPGSGACDAACLCMPIGAACTTNSNCHDQDNDGLRDDLCVWWSCDEGVCNGIDIVFADMGGPFGECPPDGVADGNDRFHALNCFANIDPDVPPPSTYPCEDFAPMAFAVDAVGPFGVCQPDGVCDGNDAFAALAAFSNVTTCSCPLDPAPQAPVRVVERTTLALMPDTITAAPGDIIEVDIMLSSAVEDLRGYQLHIDIQGGKRGAIEVIDLVIERRDDRALQPLPTWQAANVRNGQVLVGSDEPGVFVAAGSYLATAVLRISDEANGMFSVDILADASIAEHRTFLFPTRPHEAIAVDATAPAIIKVHSHSRQRTRRR